jgi:hypothetical protein
MLLGGPTGSEAPVVPPTPQSGAPAPVRAAGRQMPALSRHSPGLEQFFSAVRGRTGLEIIDLAGASQANVMFITALGHRIYSDDFLPALDEALRRGGADAATDSRLAARFIDQSLPLAAESCDGALLWDNLQFLPPVWLDAAVTRLLDVLRPQAVVLAYFNSDEKAATVPCYQYRISDEKTLHLTPRGTRAPAQFFNNRSLEKLFQRFATTKFFLTRDHLRELLVKR